MQRGILFSVCVAMTLAAGWFAVHSAQRTWLRSELGRAQREFAAENTTAAKERLARLAKRWPAEAT